MPLGVGTLPTSLDAAAAAYAHAYQPYLSHHQVIQVSVAAKTVIGLWLPSSEAIRIDYAYFF